MTYDEIDLPRRVSLADAARAIEFACEGEELRVASRGTVAAHPGSILWRYKKGREPGTLEITLLNRERRIVLSVAGSRIASWGEATIERISETLVDRVQRTPPANSAGSDAPETET